ncbi:MAG TPA: formylmethanofuran dehydrogenase subunit E family protein [Candidatus Acidoferrum sp.]|nr:formylmethanofuran dehydrogenase subunit E family protein [Candidatus Acidoferrum sp.]
MKNSILLGLAILTFTILTTMKLHAHPGDDSAVHSQPGSNIWNQAQEPTNWWSDIKSLHGHVGPWNVLGWRLGKAALHELNATWGQHELDVVCYIPLRTPYSCIADGLVVGTGNSIGRLDIRLAEALTMADVHVNVRRKDGTGPVLLLKLNQKYLAKIRNAPDAQLEPLARECGELPEKDLFVIEKLPASETNSK